MRGPRGGTIAARVLEVLDPNVWYTYAEMVRKLCVHRASIGSAMQVLYKLGAVQIRHRLPDGGWGGSVKQWRISSLPHPTSDPMYNTAGMDAWPLAECWNGYTYRS